MITLGLLCRLTNNNPRDCSPCPVRTQRQTIFNHNATSKPMTTFHLSLGSSLAHQQPSMVRWIYDRIGKIGGIYMMVFMTTNAAFSLTFLLGLALRSPKRRFHSYMIARDDLLLDCLLAGEPWSCTYTSTLVVSERKYERSFIKLLRIAKSVISNVTMTFNTLNDLPVYYLSALPPPSSS